MGRPHDRLLKIYKQPENLEPILNEGIIEIVTEKRMADIFYKCYSPLTPDILAFTEQDLYVWIGEIKGNHNKPSEEKAHRQIEKYLHEAERYNIPARGFIIVGDLIEVIED